MCEAYRQIAQSELTEAIHQMLGKKDSIPFIAFCKSVPTKQLIKINLNFDFLSMQSRPVTTPPPSSPAASDTASTELEQTTHV